MSHYFKWHLLNDECRITKPKEFLVFKEGLKDTDFSTLANLIQIYEGEKVVSEDESRKVIEKRYIFQGLYPDEVIGKDNCWCDNGRYPINHFDPTKEDNLRFIANLSRFFDEPIEFLVFDEGYPSLEPGFITLVRAVKGESQYTPMIIKAEDLG